MSEKPCESRNSRTLGAFLGELATATLTAISERFKGLSTTSSSFLGVVRRVGFATRQEEVKGVEFRSAGW